MSNKTNAIVTASYAPDFERCRVLCDTIDTHVTGYTKHYILVDDKDVAMFTALAGPRRIIVSDKTLMPWWIFRVPGSIAPKGKNMWVSPRTMPLHGWHMQQLRRIAIAHHVTEDALFYCDSDTAFSKRFDLNDLWHGEALRLFREPNAAETALSDHMIWLAHAARTMGDERIKTITHDYVRSFIGWRRDVVVDMCAHIARKHRSHWLAAIATSRKFSECMLYGAYADTLADPALHWHDDRNFCAMQWFDPAPTPQQLCDAVTNMADHEVGFGVQSFIPVDIELFRSVALGIY